MTFEIPTATVAATRSASARIRVRDAKAADYAAHITEAINKEAVRGEYTCKVAAHEDSAVLELVVNDLTQKNYDVTSAPREIVISWEKHRR